MNRFSLFFERYQEFELLMKSTYNLNQTDSLVELENRVEFRNNRAKLKYCREARNLYAHNPKIGDSFSLEPSEEMLEWLGDMINAYSKIKKCINLAITGEDIYTRNIGDKILETIQTMRRMGYTHVPILTEDQRLIGVFSENTIFQYAADEGIIEINEDSTFSELMPYLPCKKHESESFVFLERDAPVTQAKEVFEEALKRNKRIGMLFLTQNGKENEKLLGILTPWDLLGYEL